MPKTAQKHPVMYGRVSKTKKAKKSWGSVGTLFEQWGNYKVNGYLIDFKKETSYEEWGNTDTETICLVEEGSGTLLFNGEAYSVKKGFAIKLFPGQDPVVRPKGAMRLYAVQMPSPKRLKRTGEDLNRLKVINVDRVPVQVYEYESLGQEVITCAYKPGMGLLKFTFPIDKIPLHIHPYSDRIIRTVSGKGYTFAQPNMYEMNPDTFSLFPKGTVHTNGPVPGHLYTVYAFQLPWVPSKIDERNIAGVPKFVTYVGATPPRQLWKTKEDFLRVMKRFKAK